MTRVASLSFGIGAFAAALWLSAATAWADDLLGPRPNRCQRINPGSYSPLHYWLPSLYKFRAYHRPGKFSYDQAEYDLSSGGVGADHVSADHNAVNGCPASDVQKKDGGK